MLHVHNRRKLLHLPFDFLIVKSCWATRGAGAGDGAAGADTFFFLMNFIGLYSGSNSESESESTSVGRRRRLPLPTDLDSVALQLLLIEAEPLSVSEVAAKDSSSSCMNLSSGTAEQMALLLLEILAKKRLESLLLIARPCWPKMSVMPRRPAKTSKNQIKIQYPRYACDHNTITFLQQQFHALTSGNQRILESAIYLCTTFSLNKSC